MGKTDSMKLTASNKMHTSVKYHQIYDILSIFSAYSFMMMLIFDQFCFSFVFLGLPKIGTNRYT